MHGLINRSFELFIRDSYGDRVWENLARRARVDPRGFFLLQNSSGSVTDMLVAEGSNILGKTADELTEDLGAWLTQREAIRRLLRFSGRNFPEFVESLSEFPDRALMVVECLEIPRISVSRCSEAAYEVEIEGDTGLWTMLLAGVLRGMADDYGALAVIAAAAPGVRVDIAMSQYGAERPFALVAGNMHGARL
ncbi:Haem-NO-binding [Paracoccus halophilus]|uniref:Haem-NO-binding n=1 Tax=Paracoccus halophilus TaxID=376733 RepID=A0A099EYL3_9RHOB|nr:heme NO-binding domain-containing protein [Paracoccus halophilus]KGJ03525.1 hypothetical protein IT41_13870 [Paracoccus halophilus]SFA57764.1 Haem-NO-binding [Paracoccus halophilus]